MNEFKTIKEYNKCVNSIKDKIKKRKSNKVFYNKMDEKNIFIENDKGEKLYKIKYILGTGVDGETHECYDNLENLKRTAIISENSMLYAIKYIPESRFNIEEINIMKEMTEKFKDFQILFPICFELLICENMYPEFYKNFYITYDMISRSVINILFEDKKKRDEAMNKIIPGAKYMPPDEKAYMIVMDKIDYTFHEYFLLYKIDSFSLLNTIINHVIILFYIMHSRLNILHLDPHLGNIMIIKHKNINEKIILYDTKLKTRIILEIGGDIEIIPKIYDYSRSCILGKRNYINIVMTFYRHHFKQFHDKHYDKLKKNIANPKYWKYLHSIDYWKFFDSLYEYFRYIGATEGIYKYLAEFKELFKKNITLNMIGDGNDKLYYSIKNYIYMYGKNPEMKNIKMEKGDIPF